MRSSPGGKDWPGQSLVALVVELGLGGGGVPTATVITPQGAYLPGCRVVGDGEVDVGDEVLLVMPPGRGGVPYVSGAISPTPEEGALEAPGEPLASSAPGGGEMPARRARRDLVLERDGARLVMGSGGWFGLDLVGPVGDAPFDGSAYVHLGEAGAVRIVHTRRDGEGNFEATDGDEERVLLGRATQAWAARELVDKLNALAQRVIYLEGVLAQMGAAASASAPASVGASVGAGLLPLTSSPFVWEPAAPSGDEELSPIFRLSAKTEGGA